MISEGSLCASVYVYPIVHQVKYADHDNFGRGMPIKRWADMIMYPSFPLVIKVLFATTLAGIIGVP
jgi:hypothetical protein